MGNLLSVEQMNFRSNNGSKSFSASCLNKFGCFPKGGEEYTHIEIMAALY